MDRYITTPPAQALDRGAGVCVRHRAAHHSRHGTIDGASMWVHGASRCRGCHFLPLPATTGCLSRLPFLAFLPPLAFLPIEHSRGVYAANYMSDKVYYVNLACCSDNFCHLANHIDNQVDSIMSTKLLETQNEVFVKRKVGWEVKSGEYSTLCRNCYSIP
jgi:hypothetical protein